MKIMITGGAGFIGSALIRHIINDKQDTVVNLDKLTYAANLDSLESISDSNRYLFEQVDICNRANLDEMFIKHQPDHVMHLAAESHVDRSILGPAQFIETNIIGTYVLLESTRNYWEQLPDVKKGAFRFHHISTDEVYGDLKPDDEPFSETTAYDPSSPYSASKASSDHLVRAWHRTFELPIIITNCSNNYGPYHFPEKLIPLTILNAISGKPISVYGDGHQIRDWLYVEDHARALYMAITEGNIGETYNIGGSCEKRNIDVVSEICLLLEELCTEKPKKVDRYMDLITFVKDRPGHDQRYSVCSLKIQDNLGWQAEESFQTGLRKTVSWFLANRDWLSATSINKNSKRGG